MSYRNRAPGATILLASLLLLQNASLAIGTPTHFQDTDEVVRVDSDLVVLNVTVSDASGNFVTGLKKSDFKIFEDGVEQRISSFDAEETPFAAAVLLDFSGSMEQRVTLARSAAIRFLDGLRENDVAAVYRFDADVKILQDFTPGRDLASIVFDQRAKGLTVLNDAILTASKDLSKREEKRRAIVVLSDGMDTHSSASASKALASAAAADVTIYGVDMSDPMGGNIRDRMSGAGALKNFALKSGGRYVATPGGKALRDSFGAIVNELSNQYTITYRSSNHNRDGKWRNIEVKSNRLDLSLRTRKGYFGAKK
jgi:Ca-activated chloride channel homolog